jgi:hypothetical protein
MKEIQLFSFLNPSPVIFRNLLKRGVMKQRKHSAFSHTVALETPLYDTQKAASKQ